MTIRKLTALLGTVATALASLAMAPAQAQTYPERPVKVLVPYTAGGASDLDARRVAQHLEKVLGKPFIIENRPGGGGLIAAQAVAQSPADGYTLLYVGASVSTFKTLNKNQNFVTLRDLAPISTTMESTTVFSTNPQTPASNLKEFVAYVKANPGKVNYASAGRNSILLAQEALKHATQTQMTEVPFKGEADYVLALMRGDVQIVVGSYTVQRPLIEAGKIKPLAVNHDARVPQLPNVPTVAEQGYGTIPSVGWFGMFAPAATPKAIVDKLSAEIRAYEALPQTREQLVPLGVSPRGSTPEAFRAMIEKAEATWAEVAKAANIQPE